MAGDERVLIGTEEVDRFGNLLRRPHPSQWCGFLELPDLSFVVVATRERRIDITRRYGINEHAAWPEFHGKAPDDADEGVFREHVRQTTRATEKSVNRGNGDNAPDSGASSEDLKEAKDVCLDALTYLVFGQVREGLRFVVSCRVDEDMDTREVTGDFLGFCEVEVASRMPDDVVAAELETITNRRTDRAFATQNKNGSRTIASRRNHLLLSLAVFPREPGQIRDVASIYRLTAPDAVRVSA